MEKKEDNKISKKMEEYKEYYKKFGGDRGEGGEGGEKSGVLSIEGSELRGIMECSIESVYKKLCSIEILEADSRKRAESRAGSRKREEMEEKMARRRREKEEEKKRENELMEEMEEDLKLMEDLEEFQLLPIKHNVIKELKRRFKEEEMIRKRTKKQEKKKRRRRRYCEHNKRIYLCIECKGKGICEHNKNRKHCKECNKGKLCKHKKILKLCKECEKLKYCEHNKEKYYCNDCEDGKKCEHLETTRYCIKCGPMTSPEYWCKCCKYTLIYESEYSPYCIGCYYNKNPEEDESSRFMLKEYYLREEIRKRNPELVMICNRIIEESSSKLRPDIRIELESHTIIIECDEWSHMDYNCENKRMMRIFKHLGCKKPIVFIRFNPDSYINESGEIKESCFKRTKKKSNALQKTEWEIRIKELIKRLNYYLIHEPKKEVTIEYLFYAKTEDKDYLFSREYIDDNSVGKKR